MSEKQASSKRPSYRTAKEELAKSAGRVRIYGIELERPDEKSTITIWFCGYRSESTDYRTGSKRIFHIPATGIVQRGHLDNFTFEECQVEWFDIESRTRLLEESYVAFEASDFLDQPSQGSGLTALERIHGFSSPHIRGTIGGVGDVPIIIPLNPPGPSPIPIIIPLNPPGPSPVPIIIPLPA